MSCKHMRVFICVNLKNAAFLLTIGFFSGYDWRSWGEWLAVGCAETADYMPDAESRQMVFGQPSEPTDGTDRGRRTSRQGAHHAQTGSCRLSVLQRSGQLAPSYSRRRTHRTGIPILNEIIHSSVFHPASPVKLIPNTAIKIFGRLGWGLLLRY